MSNILKGLNEGRNYGRDSWDSNMPGYQGDYGGAKNFGRRNREWDEDDRIDARIRAEYEKKKEYERTGTFWLKLKDSQRHLPAGPFTGKQAANTAAVELLKQQPELKGNLVITAYGPDEQLDELSPATLASYKKKAGADASAADKRGDYARGNKRMSGIMQATKKEFANDSKGLNEEDLDENLHKWFKEKWVRFGPDGKIRGDCARGDDSEGKPKCLPQSKAQNLGKKGRASAAARKRREDPDAERHGRAINVNTKKKTNEAELDEACWKGYHKEGNKELFGKTVPNCVKNEGVAEGKEELHAQLQSINQKLKLMRGGPVGEPNSMAFVEKRKELLKQKEQILSQLKQGAAEAQHSETCPHCGGEMVSEELMNEKKDACYYKVKSRYKVWPSAYASGALVKCRKKGASNWGNGGKSNESIEEGLVYTPDSDEEESTQQNFKAYDLDWIKEKVAEWEAKGWVVKSSRKMAGKWPTGGQTQVIMVKKQQGVAEDQLDEKWSQKYKDSINCSNPKGFSQKAHCAGKQKNESAILKGLKK